ncbi:hypothetical protein C6A85_73835, partial [Mycobacterium sp. ITM-2017-0098]
MNTNSKSSVGWQGRTAAAILVAAGAAAASLLTPASAQAADQYIALALGYVNENPPVTMAGGSSIAGSQEQAAMGALTNCSN